MWITMAQTQKELRSRTWGSLKERFRRRILPNIDSFNLTKEEIENFKNRTNVKKPWKFRRAAPATKSLPDKKSNSVYSDIESSDSDGDVTQTCVADDHLPARLRGRNKEIPGKRRLDNLDSGNEMVSESDNEYSVDSPRKETAYPVNKPRKDTACNPSVSGYFPLTFETGRNKRKLERSTHVTDKSITNRDSPPKPLKRRLFSKHSNLSGFSPHTPLSETSALTSRVRPNFIKKKSTAPELLEVMEDSADSVAEEMEELPDLTKSHDSEVMSSVREKDGQSEEEEENRSDIPQPKEKEDRTAYCPKFLRRIWNQEEDDTEVEERDMSATHEDTQSEEEKDESPTQVNRQLEEEIERSHTREDEQSDGEKDRSHTQEDEQSEEEIDRSHTPEDVHLEEEIDRSHTPEDVQSDEEIERSHTPEDEQPEEENNRPPTPEDVQLEKEIDRSHTQEENGRSEEEKDGLHTQEENTQSEEEKDGSHTQEENTQSEEEKDGSHTQEENTQLEEEKDRSQTQEDGQSEEEKDRSHTQREHAQSEEEQKDRPRIHRRSSPRKLHSRLDDIESEEEMGDSLATHRRRTLDSPKHPKRRHIKGKTSWLTSETSHDSDEEDKSQKSQNIKKPSTGKKRSYDAEKDGKSSRPSSAENISPDIPLMVDDLPNVDLIDVSHTEVELSSDKDFEPKIRTKKTQSRQTPVNSPKKSDKVTQMGGPAFAKENVPESVEKPSSFVIDELEIYPLNNSNLPSDHTNKHSETKILKIRDHIIKSPIVKLRKLSPQDILKNCGSTSSISDDDTSENSEPSSVSVKSISSSTSVKAVSSSEEKLNPSYSIKRQLRSGKSHQPTAPDVPELNVRPSSKSLPMGKLRRQPIQKAKEESA